MARLAAQGRVKLLLNGGDGVPLPSQSQWGLEQKDPFINAIHHHHHHNRRRRLLRSLDSTRLYSSSSCSNNSSSSSSMNKAAKPKRLNSEAKRLFIGDEIEVVNGDDAVDVDVDVDVEFERDDELDCFRGLVLDISYRPINVVCWKRAICLEYMEKADVLEYYDQTVNSPTGSFYIPAVLRIPHLLQIVKRRRIKSNLSRKNILCRDSFTCQYCSSHENLTIDHVLPIARGGEWKWENLVTACARCNSKKGQKTIEEANMKLAKVPKAPKDYDILAIPLTSAAIKMLKMRKGIPEEWLQYLSKPSLEP